MRKQIKSWLMTLLILAPLVITPMSVVHAQTNGAVTSATVTASDANSQATATTPGIQATPSANASQSSNIDGQIIFENPAQQHLDMPIQYIRPVTMNLRAYVRMNSDTVVPAFSDGLVKIALPKTSFAKPTLDQLTTSADTLKLAAITEDETNYYIEYHLATLVAGKQISLPYSVVFTGPYKTDNPIPITQTIYDANNQVLSTNSQNITINPRPRIIGLSAGMQVLSYANHEVTDIVNPYGSYYTAKTIQKRSFYVYLYDQTLFNETNDIKFVVTLPTDIEFDTSKTTNWQYNATTNQASITVSATTDITDNVNKLPLYVRSGADISTNRRAFTFNNTITHGTQPTTTGYAPSMQITFNRWVPRERFTSAMTVKGQQVRQANVNDVSDQTPINSRLTYVANLGDSDADPSVLVNRATMNWSSDRIHGVSIQQVGPLTEAMKQNTLYGVHGLTRDKLTTNLGTTPYTVDPSVTAKYGTLELVYDQPVAVNSSTTGLAAVSHFTNSELTDYRQENKETLGRFYTEDGWMYWGKPYDDLNSGNNDVQLTLTKTAPPRIYVSSNSTQVTPSTQLYNGNTLNLGINFSYSDVAKPMTLENAEMYYILPNGLVFDESKADTVVGMSNLQVIHNYKNMGVTAVYGRVTDPQLLTGYGQQKFSLPVTSTSALHSGKIDPVIGYLVFKNNSGTYDVTDPDFGQSVMVFGQEDPYGLAPDSDVPHHNASNSITGLTYSAPSGLLSTALVKNQSSQKFVSDLGQAGDVGDQLTYRFNLINNDIATANNIGLVNVLPTVNDHNGSQFNVRLTGPVKISTAVTSASQHDYTNDFDIYYATTTPTTTAANYQHAAWTKTPTDYSQVRMIKLVLKAGHQVAAGDEINFDYPATIPNDLTIPDQAQALNDFQTTFNGGLTFASSVAAKVSVNYPTSAVQVTKIDGQTKQPLADVKFQLFDADSDQQLNSDTLYETNQQGKLSISNLKPGRYYLKELAAPTGYVLPDIATQKQTNQFTIERQQTSASQLTIANLPQRSVLIQKVDQETGQALAGAVFDISDATGKVVASGLQTDQSGQTYAYGLPAGHYTVTETKAPAGYHLAAPTTLAITATSQVVPIKVADLAIKGSFTLVNQDQLTKLPLANSRFQLSRVVAGQTDLVANDLITDAQGQLQLGQLALGDYVLQQLVVNSRYQLNNKPLTFQITAAQPQIDLVFNNQLQTNQPQKPDQGGTKIPVNNPTHVVTHQSGSSNQVSLASSPIPTMHPENKQQSGRLPQASEQSQPWLNICGLFILLVLGIPFIFRKEAAK
ncbi:MSCRAMM family protein [Lapidilactobacillus wuchangensis]|uniref:MSCRAMM family protein n=1 Tax=Lapidilactobacillus wuchangensis TaxID=2486001 RepID=UPI000F7BAF0D|nr:SpaA isopeptide-forming pilin-related protein [Lapidilactobacillus wuchangensis]